VIVPLAPERGSRFPEPEEASVFVNRRTVVTAEAVSVTLTIATLPFGTAFPFIPIAKQVCAPTADEQLTDFAAARADAPGATLIAAMSAGL
jgi:hypothetical protein